MERVAILTDGLRDPVFIIQYLSTAIAISSVALGVRTIYIHKHDTKESLKLALQPYTKTRKALDLLICIVYDILDTIFGVRLVPYRDRMKQRLVDARDRTDYVLTHKTPELSIHGRQTSPPPASASTIQSLIAEQNDVRTQLINLQYQYSESLKRTSDLEGSVSELKTSIADMRATFGDVELQRSSMVDSSIMGLRTQLEKLGCTVDSLSSRREGDEESGPLSSGRKFDDSAVMVKSEPDETKEIDGLSVAARQVGDLPVKSEETQGYDANILDEPFNYEPLTPKPYENGNPMDKDDDDDGQHSVSENDDASSSKRASRVEFSASSLPVDGHARSESTKGGSGKFFRSRTVSGGSAGAGSISDGSVRKRRGFDLSALEDFFSHKPDEEHRRKRVLSSPGKPTSASSESPGESLSASPSPSASPRSSNLANNKRHSRIEAYIVEPLERRASHIFHRDRDKEKTKRETAIASPSPPSTPAVNNT